MDQAISFMAERGNAQLIEFEPLKGYKVQLPPKYVLCTQYTHLKVLLCDS